MKVLAGLVCLVLAIVLSNGKLILKKHGPPEVDPPTLRVDAPEWGAITQRVDHFNPRDLRTWSMRYLSSGQFFEDGGPIFIYLGGEWTISAGSLMSGQIVDMAQEQKGYMFYTEHRYYGQSFPTENLSVENLQYLNVDQALADVVYFIKQQKKTIPGLANSPVVVVGCSYSASMATWIRYKYPHIVDIAYASSGPVRAVADFYEYFEVINDSIGDVSQVCLDTIKEGISMLEEEMSTTDGLTSLSERLITCNPLQNVDPNRAFFFNFIIAEIFAGLVQYAGPNSIQNDCNRILGYDGTSMDKLIRYIRAEYGQACIGDYDEFVENYSSIENNPYDIYRQWIYQTCTEYGYFQTSTSDRQPFGDTFPLDFFQRWCPDLFGERLNNTIIDTGITRTNLFYGSVTPAITKLVSVHGTVDPWHPLGILQNLNADTRTIYIHGTSHCADISSVKASDSAELVAAKNTVRETIDLWLGSLKK